MLLRKRAPWLLALFVGGFFTASAMMHFDGILQSVAILTVYVPLLISAGGNSGSQSSTLITRGLALGEIRSGDWWRVFLRELAQGLVLGCILAALGVARVLMGGEHGNLGVGLFAFSVLIGATLIGIVVMGCLVGGMMPILLNRLGLDPATSSTPFIATIVDVFGIVLYLSLAQFALGELVSAAPPGILTP
jgi:magnesium transporter